MLTVDQLNARTTGFFPGHLGIRFVHAAPGEVTAEMAVRPEFLAPNGYLHAGAVVSLADTAAGFGCVSALPAHATGFTTVELKSNHLGTALDCSARPAHLGRTTQVWDATVSHRESGRTLALFRCTQMVLYPKG